MYIERCIKSIQSQTFFEYELLIIDDGSSDGSLEIINSYIKNDSRIKLFSHNKNRGLLMARRTAYKNAKGKYIIFCDADDCLPSNALKDLYEKIEKTNSDIVISYMTIVKENGEYIDKPFSGIANNILFNKYNIFKFLLKDKISHSLVAKIFKTELFVEHKNLPDYENCNSGEDAILFYNILNHSTLISYLDKSTYYYYMNANSITHKRLTAQSLKTICIAQNERYRLLLSNKYLYKELKSKCYNSIFSLVYIEKYDKKIIQNCLNYKDSKLYFKWFAPFIFKLSIRNLFSYGYNKINKKLER